MKRFWFGFVILATVLTAQTQHSVTLTWEDPNNPVGTTYSVYRSLGLCSDPSLAFTKITSAVTVTTFIDTTVTPGGYCYRLTATFNSIESAQSASVAAWVSTFSPTNVAQTGR